MTDSPAITVVPANEAPWDDLRTVFGERGVPHDCMCQWFKLTAKEWRAAPQPEREAMFRGQTHCGEPEADAPGLVAYLDGEPVGWCAVEPRTEYPRLQTLRVPWTGRDEDRDDPGVWAVTCFVVRTGFRRRGVSRALTAAAVEHARKRGARALEGYALVPVPGKEVAWGELFVGAESVYQDCGFTEVSAPTPRRRVMRIDF
ncbi:GNAT family N-acetyltransferase [Catenulispora subtropica]|uniref:GNAT family N-acetyltransferase n=1 Tax=Catenulispora subtropica TaxID=450798 RepID=A0ABP5D057_9ACTN